MATAVLQGYPRFKGLDKTTNLPLSGGKLYTYENGTTTNKTAYTDQAKTTAHTNPIILDSAGECTLYLDGEYTLYLTDASDEEQWTLDDVNVADVTETTGTPDNLISNFSFETDTDGDGQPDAWDVVNYGTSALDTTDNRHGAQCMLFTSTGSGGGYIQSSSFIEVTENNDYTFIFSVKSSVVDIRNLVQIIWYTDAQVTISTTDVWDESAANPTSWTEKVFSVTPPATARYAKVKLTGCHPSDITSGNTRYDHVILKEQQQILLGNPTGGAKGVGTLNAAGHVYYNGDKITADAVSGFVRGFVNHIDADPGANATTLSIHSAVTASAWESVGPTGSGAANIWTAMDSIPTTAKYAIVKFYLQANASSTAASMFVYARPTGSSATADTVSLVGVVKVDANGSGTTVMNLANLCTAFIPLDSSRRFDVYWSGNTGALTAALIGWGE